MFRWITLISFAVVITGILLHHLLFPCGYTKRFSIGSLFRKLVHLFTLLFLPQHYTWPQRFLKLALLLGLFSFIVLFLTGFGPPLLGGRLHGWLLMIHATFSPVLIVCAAAIAFLAAARFSFSHKDWQTAFAMRRNRRAGSCWLTDSGIAVKAGFWLLLALTLPVTMTMVLSMFPLFGEYWQDWMFHAHRYSVLVFTLTALGELYLLVRSEVRKEFIEHTD
jgi:hypothetical protein